MLLSQEMLAIKVKINIKQQVKLKQGRLWLENCSKIPLDLEFSDK